jgi:hypothetical protein
LEKALLKLPWQTVREGVEVKLPPHPATDEQEKEHAQEKELYVLAQSHARINKDRAMRRRKLKWLWARLKQIAARFDPCLFEPIQPFDGDNGHDVGQIFLAGHRPPLDVNVTEPGCLTKRVLCERAADAGDRSNLVDREIALTILPILDSDDREHRCFARQVRLPQSRRQESSTCPSAAPATRSLPVGRALIAPAGKSSHVLYCRRRPSLAQRSTTAGRPLCRERGTAVLRFALADHASQELAVDVRYGRVELRVQSSEGH